MGPNRPSLSRLASSRLADSACSHLCWHYVPACDCPADNRCSHPRHRPDFMFSALAWTGPWAGSGRHFPSVCPVSTWSSICVCVCFFVITQNKDRTSSYKRRISVLPPCCLCRCMFSHQFVTLRPSTLGLCSRTVSQITTASPPLNGSALKSDWDTVAWPYTGRSCSKTLQCGWIKPILQRIVGHNFSTVSVKDSLPVYCKRLIAVVPPKGGKTSY